MGDYLAVGDEFGADDEFGAADDEFGAADDEFGAMVPRGRRRGMRLRLPRPGEETVYGLNATAELDHGQSAEVTALPQRRNRPKKLSIDTTLAGQFSIANITVGVEPVLSTAGSIPAAIFAANSTAPSFRAVVCEVGMTFSAVVKNTTAATDNLMFSAAVVADVLPSYERR